MKERVRKISTKVSYILFAIFVSLTLWMYVEINEKDKLTREIVVNDIIFVNQELLGNKKLLVSRILTDNPTILFEGPRTEISKLSGGVVDIEIDLENVRTVGPVTLDYEILFPESVNTSVINISKNSASQIVVVIDRLLEKEFPVEVNYTGGTVTEEYVADRPDFNPLTITISGPEEFISKIAHIYVPIPVENLATTYIAELPFILVDEQGEELESGLRVSDNLVYSQETVSVTIHIRQLKTLPLLVEFLHGATSTESNTSWMAEPLEITVAGDPSDIADLNNILLGSIDMTSFGLTSTRDFPIILPNNLENVSGETTARVFVELLGQNLVIEYRSVSNLQTINVPSGYSADLVSQSLVVTLRGTIDNLLLVKPENIRIVADLTDHHGTGSTRVPAKAHITGTEAEVDIIGDYTLVVSISEGN